MKTAHAHVHARRTSQKIASSIESAVKLHTKRGTKKDLKVTATTALSCRLSLGKTFNNVKSLPQMIVAAREQRTERGRERFGA